MGPVEEAEGSEEGARGQGPGSEEGGLLHAGAEARARLLLLVRGPPPDGLARRRGARLSCRLYSPPITAV